MLRIQRKVLPRGALHPIQVSIVALDADANEVVCKRILLRCDGRAREFKLKTGTYSLRSREVPIGCNIQGDEFRFIVDDNQDPVCVILRVGSFVQVNLAGLGGCLLPGAQMKAFYFDHVSPEAFDNELRKAPSKLEKIMAQKLGQGHVPWHQHEKLQDEE